MQFHFAWDEGTLYLVEKIGGKVLMTEAWTFFHNTEIINKTSNGAISLCMGWRHFIFCWENWR